MIWFVEVESNGKIHDPSCRRNVPEPAPAVSPEPNLHKLIRTIYPPGAGRSFKII